MLRTAIMRIMSEMLDNPGEHGIYETGRFMDRIEALLRAAMAPIEPLQLSGSEALYGFAGWLTSQDREYVASAHHDATVWADLVSKFCEANKLAPPRHDWQVLLNHPPQE